MAERLKVRVQPGASRERILAWRGDVLKVAVTAPPERGKANTAVEALLAKELGVAKSAVRVIAGGASRDKVVELEGVAPWDIRALARKGA